MGWLYPHILRWGISWSALDAQMQQQLEGSLVLLANFDFHDTPCMLGSTACRTETSGSLHLALGTIAKEQFGKLLSAILTGQGKH